jgi:hypothetical protein
MFEGTIQREIVAEAAAGDHPVQNIADSGVVAASNANGGDHGHRASLDFEKSGWTRE